MTTALLVKLLHVLSAFWFIAGLLGRTVAQAQARRAADVQTAYSLVQLGSRFELQMIRPGSLAVMLLGVFAALTSGWPVLGFLQGSSVNWVLASIVLYFSVFPLIVLVFLPRGRHFRAALEDAMAQGRITPELTAAFTDKTVAAAHVYEGFVVLGIIALMVLKPF